MESVVGLEFVDELLDVRSAAVGLSADATLALDGDCVS